jgi:glycosyltransferase involved in cell wall biosynthesis
MTPFSVVVPILNDAHLLPYTLPSVLKISPNEIVPVFAESSDNSYEVFMEICNKGNFCEINPVFIKGKNPDFKFQLAYERRQGFENATYDTILNIDADLILDKKIKDITKNYTGGLISLGFKNYPRMIQDYLRYLANPIRKKLDHDWTMIYIFSKKEWKKTENIDDVKKLVAGEDQYLKNSIKKVFKSKFIETNTYHLRPKENPRRHYIIGYKQWTDEHIGIARPLLYSIFMLKPWQIIGYYHARYKKRKL